MWFLQKERRKRTVCYLPGICHVNQNGPAESVSSKLLQFLAVYRAQIIEHNGTFESTSRCRLGDNVLLQVMQRRCAVLSWLWKRWEHVWNTHRDILQPPECAELPAMSECFSQSVKCWMHLAWIEVESHSIPQLYGTWAPGPNGL